MENNQKKSEQLMAEVLERVDISETSSSQKVRLQSAVEDKASVHYVKPQLPDKPQEKEERILLKSDVDFSFSESMQRLSKVSQIPMKTNSLRDTKAFPHELRPAALSQLEENKATFPPPRPNKESSYIDKGKKESYFRETGTREEQSETRCNVCNSDFTYEDAGFQCTNACMCKLCSIENVLACGKHCCMHCKKRFSPKVIQVMLRWAKKCHVCGIALPFNGFAKNAKCDVCLRCVKVAETTARCRKCTDFNFHIDAEDIYMIRTKKINHACCPYAEGNLLHSLLPCGHPVCKVHKGTLLVCRTCRTDVKLS